MTDRPWRGDRLPASILAIRLQALGDVTITLPYLRALRRTLPGVTLDFLTRREDAGLPRALDVVDRVESLYGGRSERVQLLAAAPLIVRLVARRYSVVLDLQNNRVSRMIRGAIAPTAWSSFDRVSPIAAGERTRLAIEAAGFPLPTVEFALSLRDPALGAGILARAGRDPDRPLVVLSPSGAFATRNWPLEHYVQFAQLWRARHGAEFAVLGLASIADKAALLATALDGSLLNLVGQTTSAEAMAIVQRASLVLTEDCGLMHMAWTAGVKTLALFGSSRHDWSAPLGAHSRCLHSGDLACGACMDAVCRYGDIHCLTRYTPERVVAEAEDLLATSRAH